MSIRLLFTCAAVITLASCTHVERASPETALAYPDAVTKPSKVDVRSWWAELDDEKLNQLIIQGRTSAFSVLIAGAREIEASAQLRAVRASLWPSLTGTGRYAVNGNQDNVDARRNTSYGLNLSWQADVFSAIRKTASAEEANLYASQELKIDAERLIASQIAASYIALASVKAEIDLTNESTERLTDALSKVSKLMNAGYATDLDTQRSAVQLADIRARAAELVAEEKRLENNLLFLIPGTKPEDISPPADLISRVVSVAGFPAAEVFLPARPDVRAADARLLAAANRLVAAEKRLLPNLSLSATLLVGSNNGQFALPENFTTAIINNLAMPLLGRGQLLADIDRNDALLAQSSITYQQTVLQALLEVDTAYVDLLSAMDIVEERKSAAGSAKKALEQSRRLFDAGEIAYLDVLFAEQERITADQLSLASQRDRLLAWARYHAALGGA